MNGAMRQAMWGYIFVLIDIRINGFDIVPDWIGFLLIAFGCAKAAETSGISIFRKGQLMAFVLILFNIVVFAVSTSSEPIINTNSKPEYSLPYLLTALGMLLHILLVYCLCNGIYRYAEEHQLPELRDSARSRWKAYLILNTIILITVAFLPNLDNSFEAIIIAAAIIGFILELTIIHLLYKASKQAYDPETPS